MHVDVTVQVNVHMHVHMHVLSACACTCLEACRSLRGAGCPPSLSLAGAALGEAGARLLSFALAAPTAGVASVGVPRLAPGPGPSSNIENQVCLLTKPILICVK